MHCLNPNCDAELPDGADRCPSCGRSVGQATENAQAGQSAAGQPVDESAPGLSAGGSDETSGSPPSSDSRVQPSFALAPFLFRAVPWTTLAVLLWHVSRVWNRDFTVFLTHRLHDLFGYPAPYLPCDSRTLFWHITLFPPVLGLTFASYWLSWPQRVLRAAVGIVAYCLLTAITIALHESPYLPQTEFRMVAMNTLVNANYLTFGIVIWVLAASPWYGRGVVVGGGLVIGGSRRRGGAVRSLFVRAWAAVRYGWVTRLLVLVMGIALAVPAFAMTGSAAGRRVRRELAEAMRQVPYFPFPSNIVVDVPVERRRARDKLAAGAIRKAVAVIEQDKQDGQTCGSVCYLVGHLFYSLRHDDPRIALELHKPGKAWLMKWRQMERH